jgi:hypothetical protein
MSRIVQEKFEVHAPAAPAAERAWATDSSARTRKGLQTRASGDGRYESYQGDGLNCLPPGMDIADQEHADLPTPRDAGELMTGTQATSDVNTTSLREGFDRKAMRPTDDMYTREHNDAFYDSVEVDGVEGFVERNNYLDRL